MPNLLSRVAGPVRQARSRLQADPRLARILHGSLSGIFGRGLGLAISVVTLPLTIRYLGKLEYGVWVTISSSVGILAVADLGIANTLTNLISEAYAADDRDKAQRYFATAFWMTVGLVILLAPLFWFAWSRIDWGSVFHLTDAGLTRQARACVAISVAYFLCLLPLNLANRVLGGYQQVHLSNYFAMAGSLAGLAALLAVIALKGTIVQLTAAYCTISLLGSVALNLWLCFWYKPWLVPSLGKARRAATSVLLRQGFLFFVLQLTGLVVFYSDNLVITHFLGAAEVTPYSVAYRLTGYASLLQSLIAPSVWPALTEAYRKGEIAWVERTYRNLNRRILAAIGCFALFLGVAGRWIIRLWAGPAAVPDAHLLWLMAAFAFVMSMTSNQALLLNASSRLRLEATVAVLAAVANLGLSIHLVTRIGAQGVILASLVSFLLFMVIPQAWEVRRVLAGRYLRRDNFAAATPEPALRKP